MNKPSLNHCLVTQNLASIIEDTIYDSDRFPDVSDISGEVIFTPNVPNGKAYQLFNSDGEAYTVPVSRVQAQIVKGKIVHEGETGVYLFAAGPGSNPDKITYSVEYRNLRSGELSFSLSPLKFEAIPGGEVDLTLATPVVGAIPAGTTKGDKGDVGPAATIISHEVLPDGDVKVKFSDGTVVTIPSAEDGETPYVKDGNWWIGDLDTGVTADGAMPQLSLAASPATGVSVTTTPQVRVVGYFYEKFVGYQDGDLYTSQNGVNWTKVGRTPLGQQVEKILPTLDGEVMCAIRQSLHRSSGWGTGSISWSKKMDVTPGAGIQPFGFNGRAGKFIVTEYSGERGTSRYAYISTNDGNNFTKVWDSNEKHGPVDGPLTHIHGVEYDHYADRFYLSEGHHPASCGLYVSVDDGATWMRPPGLFEDPSPTTIDVTPDGLVCGSDSGRAGILGVVRQDNPMDEEFIHTWVWQTGKDGVVGFGASSFRDDTTGVVYIGFRVGQPDVHPIIAGGTPTAAGLVWEWDGGTSVISDDVRNPVVVNGRLYAFGLLSGQVRTIRGNVASPGVPADPSQVRVVGTKMEAGAYAKASGIGGVAIGNSATTTGDQGSTVVGHTATAASNATAVGFETVATPGSTSLGYKATTGSGGNQVALGERSSTTGPSGAVVGSAATAGSSATAVGAQSTGATNGTAMGFNSKAGSTSVSVGYSADASAGDNSVVVGSRAKGTAGWATAVGSNSSSATGGAALGREANAATNGVSVGRLATSASGGIAIGRDATAGQDMIAIGRGATSGVGGAISIGNGVAATSANSVAFGARGIHLQPVTSTPVAPQGGGILYIRNIGGTLSLCVRMDGGAEIVIAPAAAPAT